MYRAGTATVLFIGSCSSNSNFIFLSSKMIVAPSSGLFMFHRCLRFCSRSRVSEIYGSGETLVARRTNLLEKLRLRYLKDNAESTQKQRRKTVVLMERKQNPDVSKVGDSFSFEELGLTEELMGAVHEMGITVPTEIQCVGIPAVLQGKNVALGSHTGSGKTLAYMLPLVQLLRHEEAVSGLLMKPRRPRAVVLCPTRELSEQVFRVAKAISHHARFRSILVSGGVRLRPQEDSLNAPTDMVVGTPGRILQHIDDGNMVYGGIRYVVLDEADTMFDRGFGPDIRKFLAPLKNRASKSNDLGFQTVLVAATMTKAVQRLIDDELQGVVHLRTSTFQKKVSTARHEFIKLSGAENKLESLLQVLEPSLAKGHRVMVFCNTLDSSRAVDHFLSENQIFTVNYHGQVPADQRIENLAKFKSEDGDCPTLVCTDLAARGLDLDVDHVLMFDFPLNSIDYLHRTGRTARMGAKGKVTSLVSKKDLMLANRIEEAIKTNLSLESLTLDSVRRDSMKARLISQKRSVSLAKGSSETRKGSKPLPSFPRTGKKAFLSSNQKSVPNKVRKSPKFKACVMPKTSKSFKGSREDGKRNSQQQKAGGIRSNRGRVHQSRGKFSGKSKSPATNLMLSESSSRKVNKAADANMTKLSVVGFRGRRSSAK